MKFLVFNILVIAALGILFSGGDKTVLTALQSWQETPAMLVDKVDKALTQTVRSGPEESPVSASQREGLTAEPSGRADGGLAAAPEVPGTAAAQKSHRRDEPDAAVSQQNSLQTAATSAALSTPGAPKEDVSAADIRRREVMALATNSMGPQPNTPQKITQEEDFMSATDRRRALFTLAEEMELFHAESLAQ